MNVSNSIDRPVLMAASTIVVIDVWSVGISGPEEAFVLVDVTADQIDDRLEHHAVIEQEEQVEHLGLGHGE